MTVAPVAAHSSAERLWIGNVRSLISLLDADVDMSTVGGANVATAERSLRDGSAIYALLVAYDLFGDCGQALANAGSSSARAAPVENTLIAACGRLESAARLFQRAMTLHQPRPLLAAGRLVLSVVPLLAQAASELHSLAARPTTRGG